MRRVSVVFGVVMLVLAVRSEAVFRASDLVVVPAAAAAPGVNSANWRTDLEIVNVDSVAVDVAIAFLPTGGQSNETWYRDMANMLGGRSEDGYTKVDAKLKDIQPGAAVLLEDVIKTPWGENTSGALLVFAYEAGSFLKTDPPGGTPRKVIVNSRTYSRGSTTDSKTPTFGQQIPGMPWYNSVDPNLKAKGYDRIILTGIREDASYRTNIGLVNISDPLTALEVEMILTAADGTQLKDLGFTLYPLAHVQYDAAVKDFFGIAADQSVVNATVTVIVKAWQSQAAEPSMGLIAYASRVDNVTNDPVYIEMAWPKELPWDCVFNGNCAGVGAQSLGQRPTRTRPLSPPAP